MAPIGIDFGTKDAVLAIAIIGILVLTVVFDWGVLEFIFAECFVVLAFFAGNMRQDKRIEIKYKNGEDKEH